MNTLLDDFVGNNEWPQLGEIVTEDDRDCHRDGHIVKIPMSIHRGITWFEGHFPEQPVLPGVVQVDWAARLSQRIFPALAAFTAIKNLKFKTVILPDVEISLVLTYNQAKHTVNFSYNDANDVYSSGVIVFCPR